MISVNLDKQKYIQESLLNLESTDEVTLYNQLRFIAKATEFDNVPLYPFYEYIPDESGKKVPKMLEKTSEDGVKIAHCIISRMFSFLAADVYKYFCTVENVPDVCVWLRNLDSSEDEDMKKEIIHNFDNKFSFLQYVPLYSSIYYTFRDDYIKNFETTLRMRYASKMRRSAKKLDGLLYSDSKGKKGNPKTFQKSFKR